MRAIRARDTRHQTDEEAVGVRNGGRRANRVNNGAASNEKTCSVDTDEPDHRHVAHEK